MMTSHTYYFFFFFNQPATPEIYTLSLHDALPISLRNVTPAQAAYINGLLANAATAPLGIAYAYLASGGGNKVRIGDTDRKSTRLNSSHGYISYAVFCLKKKKHIRHNHVNEQHKRQ